MSATQSWFGAVCGEVALHEIRGGHFVRATPRGAHPAPPVPADDRRLAHQARDILLANRLACLAQIGHDTRRAVRPLRARMARADLHGQRGVAHRARGR